MGDIPKKVSDRLVDAVKKYKLIVAAQKTKDIAEADTVTLVIEMLADVFGYAKLDEITSEFPVKNTSCDIATKIDNKLQTLIEVKAIGRELKDANVTQAVNYAANQGIDWVVLTNGQYWRVYFVKIKKPIEEELVVDIDFLGLDHKSDDDLETLFLLCKEGWAKSAIEDYQVEKDALSRFLIGAAILSDTVVASIRTVLHKLSPDLPHRIDADEIKAVLQSEVLKREVLEGEKADSAARKVARLMKKEKAEATSG